jgi:hypothetical protein
MRRTRTAPDFHNLTLLLSRDEMETLNGLSRRLGIEPRFVLTRGLFMMDVAHMIDDAPSYADIRVSVHCPHDGAEMVRVG